MSKLAIINDLGHGITEVNGEEQLVTFYVHIKDDDISYQGQIECFAMVKASDNANKIRDAYIDAVVVGAAGIGSTLAHSDVVAPQFYRAP